MDMLLYNTYVTGNGPIEDALQQVYMYMSTNNVITFNLYTYTLSLCGCLWKKLM